MRQAGIAFEEVVIPLYQAGSKAALLAHSPAGKVPVLRHGDRVVWDSLAIMEYLAETVSGGRALAGRCGGAGAGAFRSRPRCMRALRPCAGGLPMNLRDQPSRPEGSDARRRRHRAGQRDLARLPGAVRCWRVLPVRRVLGGRCDVCAGRDPLSHLRRGARSDLPGLCRRRARPARVPGMAGARRDRSPGSSRAMPILRRRRATHEHGQADHRQPQLLVLVAARLARGEPERHRLRDRARAPVGAGHAGRPARPLAGRQGAGARARRAGRLGFARDHRVSGRAFSAGGPVAGRCGCARHSPARSRPRCMRALRPCAPPCR